MPYQFSFVLLLICVVISSHASDTTRNFLQWKQTWPREKLEEKDIDLQTDSNLIKSIDVLDMRSDTTSIGLYTSKSQKPHAVVANGGLAALLNSKLANNNSGNHLLFAVRSFWINEANINITLGKQVFLNIHGGATVYNATSFNASTTKLCCAIDIFILINNQYYPLARVDTLLANRKRVDRSAEKIINNCFNVINKKVARSIYAGMYTKRKATSADIIANNYSKVFNLSVLLDNDIRKGVYYTWEQFKNNQSDPVDFVIQKNEKEPPTLYLKDAEGKEILTRSVYALCDGKTVYKVQEGYVFKLHRDRRSIYWMGVERREVSNRTIPSLIPGPGVTGFGTEAIGTKVKILLTPYLLNLETGQEY